MNVVADSKEADGNANVVVANDNNLTQIAFSVRQDIDSEDAEEGDLFSPYVNMSASALEADIEDMVSADEIVIDKKSIQVEFSYPLSRPVVFTLHAPSSATNFTRAELARAIGVQYQAIYEEEKNTTTLPVETMAQRVKRLDPSKTCFLMNRADTDGVYGIWGHVLGDLVLHSVSYSASRDVYVLGIDS